MAVSVNEFCEYVGSFCAANTVAVYRLAATRFLAAHGDGAIPPDALVRYVMDCNARKLSPSTILAHVSGLRHLLDFARMRGLPVPAERDMPPLRLPKVREKVAPTMTRDELAAYSRLCRDVREPYSTLMRLLPLSGLRVSEACGLRIDDVTPPGEGEGSYVIHVRPNDARTVKGVADRRVVVLREGTALLDRYTQVVYPALPGFRGSASVWVFPQADGSPIKRRGVTAEFRKLGPKMGRPDLSPHATRHAHASLLDDAGWSLVAIQRQLGHEDVSTTSRYVHNSLEQRRGLMSTVEIEGEWS